MAKFIKVRTNNYSRYRIRSNASSNSNLRYLVIRILYYTCYMTCWMKAKYSTTDPRTTLQPPTLASRSRIRQGLWCTLEHGGRCRVSPGLGQGEEVDSNRDRRGGQTQFCQLCRTLVPLQLLS